jgi:hypothetical protein
MAGLESEDGERHGFEGLDVALSEPPWAAKLFDVDGVRAAVRALTDREPTVLLILRPGRVFVQFPRGTAEPIDEPRLRAWADALVTIAKASESIDPPAKRLEPSSLERVADGDI